MKPVVDRLERDLEGEAMVVRVDVTTEVGRNTAYSYQVSAVPTFVLLASDGTMIYREVGGIDSARVKELVAADSAATGSSQQ